MKLSAGLLLLCSGLIVGILAAYLYFSHRQPVNPQSSPSPTVSATLIPSSPTPSQSSDIIISSPSADSVVTSPLTITGKARGSWFFEAQFPVKLLDANGNQVATGVAKANGDWMTSDFVPFSTTLTFSEPSTSTGQLILAKDNPSGLPGNDRFINIPVRLR